MSAELSLDVIGCSRVKRISKHVDSGIRLN